MAPKEAKAQSLESTTGTQAALTGAEVVASVTAAAASGHPTLNTKPLFKLMVEKKASDLFFTSNAPIKIKIEGQILPVNKQVLTPETVRQTAFGLMSAEQREHFTRELEIDFAISEPGLGRFRVNVFMQRGNPAMVMRYITADMPRLDALGLPEVCADLVHAQARAAAHGGRHRLRQVDHARGDDQPPQRELLRPHRHHRGPDRVPAHQQALDRQSARGRTRHQELRARAAWRGARRAGCHPDRRDPRPREHGGGDQPRRHRPPGARHPARQQLRRDARSHHQHVPARAAQADLPRPVAVPARHHGAASGHRCRQQARSRQSR